MCLDMAFSRQDGRLLLLALLALCLIPFASAFATPAWTPQHIAEEYRNSHAIPEPMLSLPAHRGRTLALDDIAYVQHYRMLCDFLVGLQYTAHDVNHGGQIEGESGSDYSIIETDNTQEAIRVWSQYAIWTGDTATYGPNIRNAMDYLTRFPAWHEDQEGGFYYGAHNCGWGMEAAAKYRTAYNDTSWNWYADSCALWTVANPVTIDTVSTTLGQLDPLAEGLAIGGLYPHAVYRHRADWHDFAVNKGRSLRRWFDRNPARLNNNEVWALCGGTALWGVCESLFAEYPDSGATWVNAHGAQLRVWTSNGTWNHSANAWYCNAQNKCYELSHDSTYWNNAVYICDSLIGLDTDHDGGITPGRGYSVTDDASWVSSYMGWMGMERIINRMSAYDVAALGFTAPNPALPYLAGDSLRVSAHIVNRGYMPQTAWVWASGTGYLDSLSVTLPAGVDSVVTFSHRWVLVDDSTLPPRSPLLLRVRGTTDADTTNDTTTVAFDIRQSVSVHGIIRAANSQTTLPARVEFYNEAYPESLWTFFAAGPDGQYFNGPRHLMAGATRIKVIPGIQYMVQEFTQDIEPPNSVVSLDFALPLADVVMVDDSPGDTLETFYQSSLDSFNLQVRVWDEARFGTPLLVGIPTVIWFTGNATQNTLDATERSALATYLTEGGNVILSGQNIPDDTANTSFLHDVLHCSLLSTNTNLHRVAGTEDDVLFGDVDLYLIGQGGAQNQTSPSSIHVLPGSTAILHYSATPFDTCGILGSYDGGHFAFFSFGIEAISGANNSTTRRSLLQRCFTWFGNPDRAKSAAELPVTASLSQNYPNPFNPTTTISFLAPRGVRPVRLTIYNLLGQEVRTLYDGMGTGTQLHITWDGLSGSGLPVSSGMYVYRLRAGETVLVRPLQLLR